MSTNDTSAPVSSNTSKRINSAAENRKLSQKEGDWQLPSGSSTTTRTRHGGIGRPNLNRKQFFDQSLSDSDDSYDPSESEESDESEGEANERVDANAKKPPATRVILEVAALKEMMSELSKCHDCNGPLDCNTLICL